MTSFDLHISSLAGPLCVVCAGEDWRLQDLHKAVVDSTAIPTDQQRLICEATILQGASQLLIELLPEGANEILCVRSRQWVEIPVYSGNPNTDHVQSRWSRIAREVKTVQEAKTKCFENEELWGFTLRSDTGHADTLQDLCFKQIDSQLGHKNRTGTTFVKLSPAGRAALLDAIRTTRCTKRYIIQAITDLDTILSAVEENAKVFPLVCEDLRCNVQVAEVAVLSNPFVLQYAPDIVKDNATIVQHAIEGNAFALQHASETIRSDREMVLLAINLEPSTIRYASEALQADVDICLIAIQRDGNVLRYLNSDLRDNHFIVMAAIQQQGKALCFASRRLRADAEVIAAAVQNNPAAAEYALSGPGSH